MLQLARAENMPFRSAPGMESRITLSSDAILLTMIASHTQVNLFGLPGIRVKTDKEILFTK